VPESNVRAEHDFELAVGRSLKGEPLPWFDTHCAQVSACVDDATLQQLGSYHFGVVEECMTEIGLLKYERGQIESDGSLSISPADLELLRSADTPAASAPRRNGTTG